MVIRYGTAVLNLAGVLALILGLLFWAGFALHLVSMHMLLGLLAVGALWVIGIGQIFSKTGSWILAACALFIGAFTIVIGLKQTSMMPGAAHWVIQLVHLLLGVLTIGLGHMAVARHRKSEKNRRS